MIIIIIFNFRKGKDFCYELTVVEGREKFVFMLPFLKMSARVYMKKVYIDLEITFLKQLD